LAAKLPALSASAFLATFAPRHTLKANGRVAGVNRNGNTFLIEVDHKGGMRPDILQSALKYLEVSREEFWEWFRKP